ncbi:SGNH/GDSL hydrolase family protein [Arthrobacter burdickii]
MNPLLMPLVLVQGRMARANMQLLPPAAGPAHGVVGREGEPSLRLVVLGESTAAGCGVATHQEGFAAAFAAELSGEPARCVSWQAVGQHGATARRIRHRLLPLVEHSFDRAVLLAGANDVLSGRTAREWGEDLTAIVDGLADRAAHVTVLAIPPFHQFPSLPLALRTYLTEEAAALDDVSRRICKTRRSVTWVRSAGLPEGQKEFFAEDGFHPSSLGYRYWAHAVAAVEATVAGE